jgi:hypothetical protein
MRAGEGVETMRKFIFTAGLAAMTLTAVGVASIGTSTPAAAHDYPYCLQGKETGIPGDCSYSSYAQCMASASGRDGYCNVNPRVAFGGPRPDRRAYRDPYYRW